MAKKWDDLRDRMGAEANARVDGRVRETLASMPLSEIRKAIGLTQAQLAETLGQGQGSVSKIEHATDMYLSTLRRFIMALGGELTVTATFPNGREFIIDSLDETSPPDDQQRQSA